VTQQRGQVLRFEAASHIVATVHPASILRAQDKESRHREYELFVKNLRVVTNVLLAPKAAQSENGLKKFEFGCIVVQINWGYCSAPGHGVTLVS
jgi:hypothetical protein